MRGQFTLEFWQTATSMWAGLSKCRACSARGETLAELRENIQDAYDLVTQEREPAPSSARQESVELEV